MPLTSKLRGYLKSLCVGWVVHYPMRCLLNILGAQEVSAIF